MKSFVNGSFNVKLIFNDETKQGHSSLFNGTKLMLKLYKIEFKLPSEFTDYSTQAFPINSPRHLNDSNRDLVGMENCIEFDGLTYGKYLIELIVDQ